MGPADGSGRAARRGMRAGARDYILSWLLQYHRSCRRHRCPFHPHRRLHRVRRAKHVGGGCRPCWRAPPPTTHGESGRPDASGHRGPPDRPCGSHSVPTPNVRIPPPADPTPLFRVVPPTSRRGQPLQLWRPPPPTSPNGITTAAAVPVSIITAGAAAARQLCSTRFAPTAEAGHLIGHRRVPPGESNTMASIARHAPLCDPPCFTLNGFVRKDRPGG